MTRRVCAAEGCSTVLSIYNKRRLCSLCEAKPAPLVLVYAPWQHKPREPRLATVAGSAL